MQLQDSLKRWAYYDFANSSYVLIYQAFLLPVYFAAVLVNQGYLGQWGLANGISTFIGVATAIFVGRYADRNSRLAVFQRGVYASFIGMVAVSLAVKYYPAYVVYLYVVTNAVFIVTLSLSDSMLPHLAHGDETYEWSGRAWGWGYVGGIACFIVVVPLQRIAGEYSPIVFLWVALFYLVFSQYALNGLKRVNLNAPTPIAREERIKIKRSDKVTLLLGYWLISECITVIILFYSTYAASELKLTTTIIGATLLVVQLVAWPATGYGGRIANSSNSLKLLGISILIWGVIIALLVSNLGWIGLGFIVLLTGLVIGNSQSYLRAQYSTVIDKSESGFQFGIYAFISQAAVLVGPIIYGLASDRLGSQRIPLIALYVFMVIGFLLVLLGMRRIKYALSENSHELSRA